MMFYSYTFVSYNEISIFLQIQFSKTLFVIAMLQYERLTVKNYLIEQIKLSFTYHYLTKY